MKKYNRREFPPLNENLIKKFQEVVVIDADGTSLGVMATRSAIQVAYNQNLDLFCVSDKVAPPVCKIVDYGKYKYEEEKRNRDNKKKAQEVKTLCISPNTQTHDLDTQVRKAVEFLNRKDKVQLVCRFKAKELAHPELGQKRLEYLVEKLEDIALVDKPISLQGRQMTTLLSPKK